MATPTQAAQSENEVEVVDDLRRLRLELLWQAHNGVYFALFALDLARKGQPEGELDEIRQSLSPIAERLGALYTKATDPRGEREGAGLS